MSELIEQMRGRARFCRDRGEVKTPDLLEAGVTELTRLQALVEQLAGELRLWRMLVNEGGVPHYTITPGAALNTVVTSTDALLVRTTLSTAKGADHGKT